MGWGQLLVQGMVFGGCHEHLGRAEQQHRALCWSRHSSGGMHGVLTARTALPVAGDLYQDPKQIPSPKHQSRRVLSPAGSVHQLCVQCQDKGGRSCTTEQCIPPSPTAQPNTVQDKHSHCCLFCKIHQSTLKELYFWNITPRFCWFFCL